jgi:transcriptional regulator with XRE-family HTH domain
MEQFPSKVLRLLDARDENQAKLSRATKIDPSQLAKWLKGRGLPSVKQLLAIARYLDVPLDYLADDAQDEPAAGPGLTADEERALWLIRELGLTSGEVLRRLAAEPGGAARAGGVGRVIAVRDLSEIERAKKRSGLEPDPKDGEVAEGKDGGPVPGSR